MPLGMAKREKFAVKRAGWALFRHLSAARIPLAEMPRQVPIIVDSVLMADGPGRLADGTWLKHKTILSGSEEGICLEDLSHPRLVLRGSAPPERSESTTIGSKHRRSGQLYHKLSRLVFASA